jgi:hypothetical protein
MPLPAEPVLAGKDVWAREAIGVGSAAPPIGHALHCPPSHRGYRPASVQCRSGAVAESFLFWREFVVHGACSPFGFRIISGTILWLAVARPAPPGWAGSIG